MFHSLLLPDVLVCTELNLGSLPTVHYTQAWSYRHCVINSGHGHPYLHWAARIDLQSQRQRTLPLLTLAIKFFLIINSRRLEKITEALMRSFIICYFSQYIIRVIELYKTMGGAFVMDGRILYLSIILHNISLISHNIHQSLKQLIIFTLILLSLHVSAIHGHHQVSTTALKHLHCKKYHNFISKLK
jgi:hypothetical protein